MSFVSTISGGVSGEMLDQASRGHDASFGLTGHGASPTAELQQVATIVVATVTHDGSVLLPGHRSLDCASRARFQTSRRCNDLAAVGRVPDDARLMGTWRHSPTSVT